MHPPLSGDGRRPQGWRFALLATAGLALLAAAKFWPLVRPWEREFFSMDLSLGIEGYFYSLLKRGVLFLWGWAGRREHTFHGQGSLAVNRGAPRPRPGGPNSRGPILLKIDR